MSDTMKLWAPAAGVAVSAKAGVGPSVPGAGLHRSSPLFPLFDSQPVPAFESLDNAVVDFLVYREPFRVLGRLFRTHSATDSITCWFGIGLASVVIVRPRGEPVPEACQDFSAHLLVGEHWTVSSGRLGAVEYSGQRSASALPDIELPTGLIPGDEPTAVFEEFFLSLGLALRRAATYTPSEMPVLRGVEDEVRGLYANVAYLSGSRESTPVPEDFEDYDLGNSLAREQLYQLAMDKVVQVNSALSYVVSQAFRGGPPLLQSAALIQRHSLLGIGRAHRALTNLVREIERALHATSVRASIALGWGHFPPLPGFGSALGAVDSSGWARLRLPDVLLRPTVSWHARR